MEAYFKVKNPVLIAAVLMLGTFLGLFGETSLNMAMTNIMEDFSVSESIAQWITTGYLLMLAILVPLSSYLVRSFTTRQLIHTALIFSVIGSLIAALSPNFTVLLIGRLIQAIGTGIFLPLMFNVVMLIFPVQKRGPVMGIVGIVLTAGPALGPSVSGLIISASNWHYIFWLMLTVYAIILVVSLVKMENISEVSKPRLDIISLICSSLGLGGIVFALATLAEHSITDLIIYGPLVGGIVFLILFVIRQLKMSEPMIDLSVFKYPMFSLGVVLMCSTLFMILSVAILIPMFLKTVLGFAALTAGLCMLPGNFLNIVMSPIVGANFDKVGAKRFTRIGFTVVTIALLLFLFTISATTPTWVVIVTLCIFFVGVSMTIMPAQTNAMNALNPQQFADGSAALNTLTQVAGAAGTAVAITMFTFGKNSYIEKHGAANPAEFLANGVHTAFILLVVLSVLALIASLFIKNSRPVGH